MKLLLSHSLLWPFNFAFQDGPDRCFFFDSLVVLLGVVYAFREHKQNPKRMRTTFLFCYKFHTTDFLLDKNMVFIMLFMLLLLLFLCVGITGHFAL